MAFKIDETVDIVHKEVADKDIPHILKKEEKKLDSMYSIGNEQSSSSSPHYEGFWDDSTTESLIQVISGFIGAWNKRAGEIIEGDIHILTPPTTQMLNKYIPTGAGLEISFAMVWLAVCFKIFQEIMRSKSNVN